MVFWDLGGFGWMITLMNDGWRLDPKDLYTNLKVLVLRPLCTFGHLTKTFSTIGRKVFLPKHGPGIAAQRRSQIVWDILSLEQQPTLGWPGHMTMDPFVSGYRRQMIAK